MTEHNTLYTNILFQASAITWPSISNFFVALVHVSSFRLGRLTHVDQTVKQTHHALTPLLFSLLPSYQLFDIETSALISKDTLLFCTVISTSSIRIIFQHSRSKLIHT